MAEQVIQAGKKIDAITRKELDDALGSHLRSWVAETAIGGRFVRFAGTGSVATAAVSIGGATGLQELGPLAGFVWDVRRLRITGLAANDVANVYINDANPAALVGSTADLSTGSRVFLWNRQVVLYPGDTLLVTGSSLIATGQITVSGQVLELPVGLAWKLTN